MNSLPKLYAPLVYLDAMIEADHTIGNFITRVIAEECRQTGETGWRFHLHSLQQKRKEKKAEERYFRCDPPDKEDREANQPQTSRVNSASTQKHSIER